MCERKQLSASQIRQFLLCLIITENTWYNEHTCITKTIKGSKSSCGVRFYYIRLHKLWLDYYIFLSINLSRFNTHALVPITILAGYNYFDKFNCNIFNYLTMITITTIPFSNNF